MPSVGRVLCFLLPDYFGVFYSFFRPSRVGPGSPRAVDMSPSLETQDFSKADLSASPYMSPMVCVGVFASLVRLWLGFETCFTVLLVVRFFLVLFGKSFMVRAYHVGGTGHDCACLLAHFANRYVVWFFTQRGHKCDVPYGPQ